MKYTTPEIEVLELDVIDVIQTSSESGVILDKDDALPVG